MPMILLHVLHRTPCLSKGARQPTAPSPLAVRTTRRTTACACAGPGLIFTLLFFIRTVGFISIRGIKGADDFCELNDGKCPD